MPTSYDKLQDTLQKDLARKVLNLEKALAHLKGRVTKLEKIIVLASKKAEGKDKPHE